MNGRESQEDEHQGYELVEVTSDVAATFHNFFLKTSTSAPGHRLKL